MVRPNIKLGDLVRDRISKFEGIAVARTEWLNGCIRITLQPQIMHDGKPVDNQTFDVEQLEVKKVGAFFPGTPSGGDRPNVSRAADPRR